MNKEPVVARRSQKLKLGIVGHGFVGQAVDYGFTTPHVEKFIVDPKYGDSNTNVTDNTVPSSTSSSAYLKF